MTQYDAYGKELVVGDTIVYPIITIDGPPIIAVFEIAAIDDWEWTDEQLEQLGEIYGPNQLVSQCRISVIQPGGNDEDDYYHMFISDPERAIIITGLDLGTRYHLPDPDIRGFWYKPGVKRRWPNQNQKGGGRANKFAEVSR